MHKSAKKDDKYNIVLIKDFICWSSTFAQNPVVQESKQLIYHGIPGATKNSVLVKGEKLIKCDMGAWTNLVYKQFIASEKLRFIITKFIVDAPASPAFFQKSGTQQEKEVVHFETIY